jgi:peroxiredoxin
MWPLNVEQIQGKYKIVLVFGSKVGSLCRLEVCQFSNIIVWIYNMYVVQYIFIYMWIIFQPPGAVVGVIVW